MGCSHGIHIDTLAPFHYDPGRIKIQLRLRWHGTSLAFVLERRETLMLSRTPCPVCNAQATAEFLRRDGVPVHQHTLMPSRQAARSIARGSLGMHICTQCGFVFNAQFDPVVLDYGSAYDNSQACSAAFESYLDETVAYLLGDRGVQGARIVEVGCGKGTFLRKLVADPVAGNRAVGFDPSYLGPESEFSGRLRFVKQFFDATRLAIAADFEPNVVVCRHVIEHVERPVAFLETIGAALQASGATSARVFFETPCVEWILRKRVVWDFFYEHCSLFSSMSLASTFQRAGFDVSRVTHLFGGQYLWLEANWTKNSPPAAGSISAATDPGVLVELADRFAAVEGAQRAAWIEETRRLRRTGRVALWGGGAKGVTFANLVDPSAQLIDCVVDVNPQKQGKFLPGTGHPIVAPSQLGDHGVSTALVLNSNYVDEIQHTLHGLNSDVVAVDLMATSRVPGERACQFDHGLR